MLKRWSRNNIINIIVLAAVMLSGAAPLYAGITLNLQSKATVSNDYIQIRDIATVENEDGDKSEIENIYLGKSPRINEVKTLNKWVIRECLLTHGIAEAGLIIIGNDTVTVTKASTRDLFAQYNLKSCKSAVAEDEKVQEIAKGNKPAKKEISAPVKVDSSQVRKELDSLVMECVRSYYDKVFARSRLKAEFDLVSLQNNAYEISNINSVAIDYAPENTNSKSMRISFAAYDRLNNRLNSFYGNFKVKFLKPVIVAKGFIPRGVQITSDRLDMGYAEIQGNKNVYYDPNMIVGKKTKRDILAGSPIYQGLVEIPEIVKRNQPVQVIAKKGSFVIRQFGLAIQSGGAGEIIKVKNTRSGKIFPARIMENGSLELVLF